MNPEHEQDIRRYLLGEIPSVEPSDAEMFDLVETELIDEYVRGELNPRQHRAFETYYLRSPDRRRKVERARSIHRVIRKSNARRSPLLTATLIVAIASVLAYWSFRPVALLPGFARDANVTYPEISRGLPRRVRLVLPESVTPGMARLVLRDSIGEIWSKDLRIAGGSSFVTFTLPTWNLRPSTYTIEIRQRIDGAGETTAAYALRID